MHSTADEVRRLCSYKDPSTERINLLYSINTPKAITLLKTDLVQTSFFKSATKSQSNSSQDNFKITKIVQTNLQSTQQNTSNSHLTTNTTHQTMEQLFHHFTQPTPSTERYEEEYYCSKTTLGVPLKEYYSTSTAIENLEKVRMDDRQMDGWKS